MINFITDISIIVRLDADLAKLGDTNDQIAANLIARNIKGIWADSYRCPVAVYLASLGYRDINLTSHNCYFANPANPNGARARATLNGPISTFIQQGDEDGATRWPGITAQRTRSSL